MSNKTDREAFERAVGDAKARMDDPYDAKAWDLGVPSSAMKSLEQDPSYSHQMAVYVGNAATLRLIEAAPDLLAALERMVKTATGPDGQLGGVSLEDRKVAEAAIARAKGE